MELIVFIKLSDHKATQKLAPIVHAKLFKKIYVLRTYPLNLPGTIDVNPPKWALKLGPLSEMCRLVQGVHLCATRSIGAVMGFYLRASGILAFLTAKVFRKTLVQNIIGDDFEVHPCLRGTLLKMFKGSDLVTVRGDSSLEFVTKLGIPRERCFILHNPYTFPEPVIEELDFSKKIYDFVYVGALVDLKQVKQLMTSFQRAYHNCKEKNPKLCIVGDGPLDEQLKSYARELDLFENIEFMGHLRNQDALKCIRKSRFFVMNSRIEGLPMAMIESMSVGVPPIMPNVGNVSDFLRHGQNGLLFPTNDFDALTEHMENAIQDPALYDRLCDGLKDFNSKNAELFSVEGISKQWKKAIHSSP